MTDSVKRTALRELRESKISLKELGPLLVKTVRAWSDDRCSTMGAAIAYYTLFSLAPLILIIVSVAGMIFGEEAARGEVFVQLQGLLGDGGAQAVQDLLTSVNKPGGGIVATLTGVVLMIIGATTVFAELQSTLDYIWRAPPAQENGIWSLIRTRLLSFGLILGVGFLLVVSLLMSAGLAAVQKVWAPWFTDWNILLNVVNAVVSFALLTVLFAMIYKLMPRVPIAWADVWLGAVITSLLFGLGRHLIGLYIGRGAVASGFGAAGSLVVVLVWVYYSTQIFLFGAEFTSVIAQRKGTHPHLPVQEDRK